MFIMWPVGGFEAGLTAGIIAGFATGFTFLRKSPAPIPRSPGGMARALLAGVPRLDRTGAAAVDVAEASPSTSLSQDRVMFLFSGLAGAGVIGLVAVVSPEPPLGLAYCLAAAVIAGLSRAAWGTFAIGSFLLSAAGRLPWRLMAFLADAHGRGVLRQAGASYQFRHIALQRQLASRVVSGGSQAGCSHAPPRPTAPQRRR